ncbi:MAG: cation:proton antiporter [Alphaproteobacteria bacterium]
MHGADQLTGVALVVVVAALIGLGLARLRQPAIVGYILTGVILGPSGLGLVDDRAAISFLAELGIILLLYFIGMELSLRSFRLIWRVAVGIVLVQIVLGVLAIAPPALLFDWPIEWLVLGGFCLALSSTAVAFNLLEDVDALKSRAGRMAMGILIAQDLAVAPMLLIVDGLKNLPSVKATNGDGTIISQSDLSTGFAFMAGELVLTIAILALIIFYLSRRTRIDLVIFHHVENRRDLLPLIALATCFGVATFAGLIGLSPAFGAFMAGLVIGNSRQREIMQTSAQPVQIVLLMVFFLSVGLLLDLSYVWDNLLLILSLWILVTLFKTASNMFLSRLAGMSWTDSLTVALVIGQMGEFSFLLAATAYGAGVIDSDVNRLIISLTVLSLITSPLYVQLVRRNRHRAMRHIHGLNEMMRLFFFREWRFTRAIRRHSSVVALKTRFTRKPPQDNEAQDE